MYINIYYIFNHSLPILYLLLCFLHVFYNISFFFLNSTHNPGDETLCKLAATIKY